MAKCCSKCKQTKEDFGPDKRASDKLQSQCRDCVNAWFRANRPKQSKEYRSAANKKHAAAYPAKTNARSAQRRALKLQRTPKWLTAQHLVQIEIFYDAAHRLSKEFGIKMHVDHVVPLKGKYVSGLHVPWNLQVISEAENCAKSNK